MALRPLAVSALAVSGVAGCAGAGSGLRDSTANTRDELPGYTKFMHESGDIRHAVYVSDSGPGPGVIILHELTGLHKPTKDFADWLVERGYRVYLPLLFGPSMSRQPVRNMIRICIKREIYLFSRGRNSPLTGWLRSLAQVAQVEAGDSPIGVVGMCLTGGFVLPLIADDAIVAGVAAQPSLPILAENSLGMAKSTLKAVSDANSNEVLSLRFEKDTLSSSVRHSRIADAMCGDNVPVCDEYELMEVPGEGHSTLTGDYPLALSRGVNTRAKVLQLFERKLKRRWQLAQSDERRFQ